jgi:hypothetical protein
MPTVLKDVSGFAAAEEVLAYLSRALNNKLNQSEPSADPGSDFKRLDDALRKVLDARLALAAVRLRDINDDIANSEIVGEIEAAAADAKKEADRIKRATKIVSDMVAFVDQVTQGTGLIGKILSL